MFVGSYTRSPGGAQEVMFTGDETGMVHLIDALMLGGEKLGPEDSSGQLLCRLGNELADLTGLVHSERSWEERKTVTGPAARR